MKRMLILAGTLIVTLLLLLAIDKRSSRRSRHESQEANTSITPARSYSIAKVSAEKTSGGTHDAIVHMEQMRPNPHLWWNDNSDSMRIYRERVETMKRTGALRPLPTLRPSAVEEVIENSR